MDINVLKEVQESMGQGDWALCLQWVQYPHRTHIETGYRFIWKDEKGHMRPQAGQARIISLALAMRLMAQALAEGWGDKQGTRTDVPK